MTGIEDKESVTWISDRLGREAKLVRWGHFGRPLLLFPTAGGDAEEVERMLLIQALSPLIDGGAIKVYSCDSLAGRALLTGEGDAQHQMWVQDQFHRYVRHEVVPAIRRDCNSDDIEIWATGASIGAFNAVAMVCRWPDVFSRAIAMSGTYDLRRFFNAHHFTDEFWVSSPLHFVPTLEGRHLDVLRTRYIHIISGEGRAESIDESWALADTLGHMGVPNWMESWGAQWHHDWPTWRAMLPTVLSRWT